MSNINSIGLKEFVDKKLSNETPDEKEVIKEATLAAVNGGLGYMFSYKELDSDDKMTIEAVLARGNNIYDLVFVDNIGRFQMSALYHMLNSIKFLGSVYNFICFFLCLPVLHFCYCVDLYYAFSPPHPILSLFLILFYPFIIRYS
jgi:hypothetical protein